MVESPILEVDAVAAPDLLAAPASLRRRYGYKLVSNVVGFAASLVTAAVIPRALGPAAYGSFGFLTNFGNQLVMFLDSGTSLGLYVKLSQRPRDQGLLRFYWGVVGVLTVVAVLLVSVTYGVGLEGWVWPEQRTVYVWLAVGLGLLTWYSQIVAKIIDAYGLTVGGEIVQMQQRALAASLIVGVFIVYRFGLFEYFIYQYVLLGFLLIASWRLLRRHGREVLPDVALTTLEVRRYTREFVDYASPLLTFTFVSVLVAIAERWFLQRYGGSVEQGFYSLSARVGAICFLFTGAMTPLLAREFSQAHVTGDRPLMRRLFSRYVPLLYTVTAFFAVFLAVQANTVAALLGGREFRSAGSAIAIMTFYPLFQTYGQLSGSLFYATGDTRLYRDIGIATTAIGLPVTFWLLAPARLMGLELGATGLALKTVVVAAIGVNLQLWFNARRLELSFWRFVAHQVYAVCLLLAVALLATYAAGAIVPGPIPRFLVAGVLYAAGAVLLTVAVPAVVSMSREELADQAREIRSRARAALR